MHQMWFIFAPATGIILFQVFSSIIAEFFIWISFLCYKNP